MTSFTCTHSALINPFDVQFSILIVVVTAALFPVQLRGDRKYHRFQGACDNCLFLYCLICTHPALWQIYAKVIWCWDEGKQALHSNTNICACTLTYSHRLYLQTYTFLGLFLHQSSEATMSSRAIPSNDSSALLVYYLHSFSNLR